MISDRERQEDEIFALQNIYDASEYRFIKKTNIECSFSIICEPNDEELVIEIDDSLTRTLKDSKKLHVQHLPPIRLYVLLPEDYPSKTSPKYYIAINWLPPWLASSICQKLDELWIANEFSEILFIWIDFLKTSLLHFLNLKDTLDVSFLFAMFRDSENKYLAEVLRWMDNRVIYGGLYLDPLEKLKDYNIYANVLEFEGSNHECSICLAEKSGKICVKIDDCNHIFCKSCLTQFLQLKIEDKNIYNIRCPAVDCKITLKMNFIKELCSPNTLKRYQKCVWEIKQLSTKNLVYCPRKICQKPVYVENGESLASCSNCEYNFCAYCFKVYHGIVPCDMDIKEKLKLIAEYQNCNGAARKFLEKKYGKNQIRELVEKQLTKNYLKDNTKLCPTCNAVITKISGCNLMTCTCCSTNFCWLCNNKIVSHDVYEHFKSLSDGQCIGRLFEGAFESKDLNDEINDLDLIHNLEFFVNDLN